MQDMIDQALAALDKANIAGYFEAMGKISFGSETSTFAQLQNNFISFSGNIPPHFLGILRVFAQKIAQTVPAPFPHEIIPPVGGADLCLGREGDLQTIERILFEELQQQKEVLLLVNGQGGMGKTTIAYEYYARHKRKRSYAHMAWLLAGEQLPESLLPLADAMQMKFPPEMPNTERFKKLLAQLQTLPAPCLLVLDNANNLTDLDAHYKDLQQCTHIHFLFTTRASSKRGRVHKIIGLDNATTLELFKRHYTGHQATENDLVLKIYEAVGKNTLVMEILAKNLENINTEFEQPYPLSQMLEDIAKSGVLAIRQGRQDKETIRVDWHDWEISPAPPEGIITALFDSARAPLTEPERALLSVFAVLPADYIPHALLKNCLPRFPDLDKVAQSLVHKGWIEQEDTSLKCRPVVQAVVRQQHAPRLWTDCEALIERFYFLFETNNYYLVILDHNLAPAYAPCVAAALYWIKEQNYMIGWVGIFLSDYYRSIGKVLEALRLLEQAKSIFQAIADTRNYGTCLQRLGDIYVQVGKLSEALQAGTEFLEITEKAYQTLPYPDRKRDLAIACEKVGWIYSELGEPTQALPFFERDVALSQELHTDFPQDKSYQQDVAIAYSALGSVYQDLGKLQQALPFFERYLALSEALYVDEPYNIGFNKSVAIAYSKLGVMHLLLDDIVLAQTHFQQYYDLSTELAQDCPDMLAFAMDLAESIAVCWAVGKLAGEAGDTQTVEQARATFDALYQSTQRVNCKKKSAIIGRMLEAGADLRALVIEMSRF